MLDTGNFMLVSQNSCMLWQSFDEPSDTLLPTQTMNRGQQLIARLTEKNFLGGRFSFRLFPDGNLALYTTNFPFYNITNSYYWAYEEQGLGYQVVFNPSGFLYLTEKNGSIVTEILDESMDDNQVLYHRVILEYDGVLRHYVYPKPSPRSSSWLIKSFTQDNICTSVIQQTGSGVCGYNSYCKLGNDKKPRCFCPPGYTIIDPTNEMSGCFQNFLPQSCEEVSNEKNWFNFEVLQDVDWPLSDYEHFQNVSIDWCREICLEDCFCAVVIFREGGDCWKKKLPLSNGKNDSEVDRTAFVKVRISGGFSVTHYKQSKRLWKALLATSGSVNIILIGLVIIWLLFFKSKKGTKSSANCNVRTFSYKELVEATNGFSEELGRGAFGMVYKGAFTDQKGSLTCIAVKRLETLSNNADKEFRAEVNSIGHTHHRNLVKLIGFCEDGEQRMLVYEYMTNGTLFEFLYKPPKPSWQKRVRIAQGVARGLLYLHDDCSTQILHSDIKPQNILLDDDHNARISDFGLAKLLKLDQTQTNTEPRGTRGYAAPEWFNNTPITAKVDVYSFGILVLEIICCQRHVFQGENNGKEDVVLLIDRAFDCYQSETIDELLNDDREALDNKEILERMVKISIWCFQNDPNLRPTMRMVVDMLEGLIQVPEPPCPHAYSTSFTT